MTAKAKTTTRERSRTKGRPSAGTEKVGRDVIIAKTCELLRTHAPSEVTRVLAARASEVHPSLIHYYFKTRHSLMVAAAAQLSEEFMAASARRMQGVGGSPRERLIARVETLIDLEITNPYFHRLLIEEVLTSDDPEARALTDQLASHGIAHYQMIIEEGVATGELRDVDSGWLFTSVISLCQFFEKAKIFYRALAHPEVSEAELEQSYRRFLRDFVVNATVACPAGDHAASRS